MSLRARLLAVALLSSGVAHAQGNEATTAAPSPTVAQCAAAYEGAQEQRKAGELLAARETLRTCANDACPDFIRKDCDAWYGAVQGELPTLVFTAQSLGRDLVDVSISLGERVLASRIDGQAIELDPGDYDFAFSARGMQPLTQHLVVARGEQNRLVRVELVPVAVPLLRAAPSNSALPAPTAERSFLLPAIFFGAGAAGIASFGALGAWGRSSEARLEERCAPDCSHEQISGIKNKYLLADISLGLGIGSLAVGTYLLLRPTGDAPKPSSARFDVRAGSSSFNATYGGVF